MLAEVRKSFDGKAVLHETAPAIELVSGFSAVDKVDRAGFIGRIPGYDLYSYLKSKLSGFKDATVMGRALFGNFIYLPLNRIALNEIMKYELWKEDPDSEAVREHVEKLTRLARKITVHEFVHLVDDISPRLLRREDMDPELRRELQHRALGGIYDEYLHESTNVGLGRLPLKELVAIATTSLVLGEPVLKDVSQGTLEECAEVERKCRMLLSDRIDFFLHAPVYRDFMIDNRHMLAYRFLDVVMPVTEAYTVCILLSRPPTFMELLDPVRYLT